MGNVILVIQVKDVAYADWQAKADDIATNAIKVLGAEIVSKQYSENK